MDEKPKKFRVKRISRSGVVHEHIVIVDAQDAHLLRSSYWIAQYGHDHNGKERIYINRSALSGGAQSLGNVILGLGVNEKVYHINHDTLDCRRANLMSTKDRVQEIE